VTFFYKDKTGRAVTIKMKFYYTKNESILGNSFQRIP